MATEAAIAVLKWVNLLLHLIISLEQQDNEQNRIFWHPHYHDFNKNGII